MTATIITALIAFFGVAISSFFGWRANKRVSSGDIQTTEASRLWDASEKMRDDLSHDNERLEERLDAAEQTIREQSRKIRVLEREKIEMERRLAKLESEVEVAQMDAENCRRREEALTKRLEEAGLL